MKRLWFPLLISITLFNGCILFTPPDVPQSKDVFYLTDLGENPTTTFSSGEDFYMYFNLVNTTQDSVDYSFTGMPVFFTIYKGLTRIIGKTDGLSFAQVIINAKLAPGDTLKEMWLAPTPVIQSYRVELDPGQYKAVADFPAIDTLQTDTIANTIYFTVIE